MVTEETTSDRSTRPDAVDPPNAPGRRVERRGPSLARPWHSPGDPTFRTSGIFVFAIGVALGLAALAVYAIPSGAPDPWVWAYVLAIIVTDGTELPVSAGRTEYKVVVNDVLVLVPFATFAATDVAWMLLAVTVASSLVLPLSWGMRFAHVSSGLAYRSLLWGAGAAALAAGGSAYVAVLAMVATSVAYEFTLFRPFAHILVEAPPSSYREFVRDAAPLQVLLASVHAPLALVGVAAAGVAPWSVPLLAVPVLVAWRIALLGPRVRELSETDRMKSRFISMASHELQTPLTSVIGFAQTLDERWDEIDDAERRRFLKIIREQGARLSRLVADLLVLSSIDADRTVRERVDVDVQHVVELALRDADIDSDEHDVTVSIAAGLSVRAAEDDVVRMLVNLLSNARKYGRPPIEIDARGAGAGWAKVSVIDHGPGIPEDARAKVFDHFARGDDIPSSIQGSGLGLAIARSLARELDGDLRYEQLSDSSGACFSLLLPTSPRSKGSATSTPVD